MWSRSILTSSARYVTPWCGASPPACADARNSCTSRSGAHIRLFRNGAVETADPEGFKATLLDGLHVDDRFFVLAPEMPCPDGQVCLGAENVTPVDRFPLDERYRAFVLAEPIALERA